MARPKTSPDNLFSEEILPNGFGAIHLGRVVLVKQNFRWGISPVTAFLYVFRKVLVDEWCLNQGVHVVGAERCKKMPKVVRRCKKVQEHVERCKKLHEGARRHKKMQEDARRCKKVQEDARKWKRCKKMQKDAKRCKKMQKDAKRCKKIQKEMQKMQKDARVKTKLYFCSSVL